MRNWAYWFVLVSLMGWSSGSLQALDFRRHPDADSNKLNAILATGEVRAGDADRLLNYLRTLPKKQNTAIYLSSPGGNLYEGMRLGRLFRRERIKTVIEGGEMCASACALAFLGGRDRQGRRWMSSTTTSQLGFHAFRNGNGSMAGTDDTQLIVSHVLQYGRDVAAPIDILIANFGTPSSEMYWFRRNELLYLGIKIWDMTNKCFLPCN